MTLTAAHRAAICKVLPLLRADTMDTERLAALRAIDRILARAQAGWGDVAALVAGTRTETGQAKWSTGWEREWAEFKDVQPRAARSSWSQVECKAMLRTLKAILDRKSMGEFGERAQQFMVGLTQKASRTGGKMRLTKKQDSWLRGLAAEVGIRLPWSEIL